MTISVQAKGAPQAPVTPASQVVNQLNQAEPRQVSTTEAPQPEVTPEAAKADPMSPKFAALAKKERQLQAIQGKLKAERDALKVEQTKYQTGYYSKEKLLSDPLAVLSEVGIDYNSLTEKILNSGQATDPVIQQLMKQVDELREGQTKAQREAEEGRKQSYENAVTQVRGEVQALVDSSKDFEIIKAMGETESVVELIKATYESEKRIMTTEEACKEVEDFLVEEAMKIAAIEKIKAKFLPPKEEAPKELVPEAKKQQVTPQQPQQPKTLSSSTSSSGKPLTPRERAILVAQGHRFN